MEPPEVIVKSALSTLENIVTTLTQSNASNAAKLQQANARIQQLENDIVELKRVSRVVSLQNENAKLRQELEEARSFRIRNTSRASSGPACSES